MSNSQFTVDQEDSAAHKVLLETRTLTEVRNESSDSDADRANILLETQTVSKTNSEVRDSDSDTKTSVEWLYGERQSLHFRNVSDANDAPVELNYDEDLEMCVDELRRPLVSVNYAPETHTLTSTRSEMNDTDK